MDGLDVGVWIASGALAVAFGMAGAMKAFKADKLQDKMGWIEDVGVPRTRLIGYAEMAGAIGLLLPPLTGILPWLAGAAAVGLAIVQAGALVVHTRRREFQMYPVNLALLATALFVAWGRLLA